MLKNKKAQGLSVTTIVVAIIALIVIVVLILMFTGRLGEFSSGTRKIGGDITKTCSDLDGGELKPISECTGRIVISSDVGSNICCIG